MAQWLDGAEVSASGWGSRGPRFQSHPRLTFQSCSRYQLNQLESIAASESTFKKSNTCGVSNNRLYFFTFTIRQLSIPGNIETRFWWPDVLPGVNQLGRGKRRCNLATSSLSEQQELPPYHKFCLQTVNSASVPLILPLYRNPWALNLNGDEDVRMMTELLSHSIQLFTLSF